MPKETFFNLPDEKRERITAVAIEEFGHNEYADVSISRIVAKAGIAIGAGTPELRRTIIWALGAVIGVGAVSVAVMLL